MSAKGIHVQVGTIILLYGLLGSSSSGQAQPRSPEQPMQTCPTGSLLAFSRTNKSGQAPDRIYIRRRGSFDRRIWETPALPVTVNGNGETTEDHGIGFIVPQLGRGRYDAWYGGADLAQARDSLTFDAIPQLLVENAITRGQPLSEVHVAVRIFSPKLTSKDSAVPEQVSALVTLKTPDPSLAEIVSLQRVRTDKDGYARWTLRLKKAGIAQLVASAYQFESAVLTVVGMPASGPTFAQAELAYLNDRAAELERSAASAVAVADQRSARLEESKRAAIVADSAGRVASVTPDTRSRDREQTIMMQTYEVTRLRQEATQADLQAKAARATAQTWAAATAHQPRPISELELQPGDVLLVLGSSTISAKIRSFEQRNLGGEISYSHASLYLGEFDHVKMVGEMWPSGFWITPLPVSVQGTYLVDVYRFRDLEEAKRQELANFTAHMFSNGSRVVRTDSPSFLAGGSFLPYAFEEITLLGLAGTGWPGRILTYTIQTLVDPNAGGRRKMICSELVAWTYHDAGLELDVPYWKVLSDLNIFTSHERQHDYTTPNMLAHSRNLGLVGRYRAP